VGERTIMSKALGITAVVATLIAAATNGVRGGDYSTSDQEADAPAWPPNARQSRTSTESPSEPA
jgi:hypothetical protein